jgi:hypothetical protein
MNTHSHPILDAAPGVTYTAMGSTVVFWGLHISDIAVILSASATICGVALQFYVALHRIRMLEVNQAAGNIKSAVNSAAIAVVAQKTGDLADTMQTAISEANLKGDDHSG